MIIIIIVTTTTTTIKIIIIITSSTTIITKTITTTINKVLSDPYLRSLLMDSEFQALLLKCQSDPEEFKKYMRDPQTGNKIQALRSAGLLGF